MPAQGTGHPYRTPGVVEPLLALGEGSFVRIVHGPDAGRTGDVIGRGTLTPELLLVRLENGAREFFWPEEVVAMPAQTKQPPPWWWPQ